MLSHDTTIVLRVTHSTHQLIDLFCDLVSVVLKYKINARQKTYLGFSALETIPVFFDRAPDLYLYCISIRNIQSLASFKQALKTYFFKIVF